MKIEVIFSKDVGFLLSKENTISIVPLGGFFIISKPKRYFLDPDEVDFKLFKILIVRKALLPSNFEDITNKTIILTLWLNNLKNVISEIDKIKVLHATTISYLFNKQLFSNQKLLKKYFECYKNIMNEVKLIKFLEVK